jgi:sigma-54 dependent transcriptional regulator, acetoin dehydrogenase operon transcriptional activator AcoR
MATPTPGIISRGRSARRDDGYDRPIASALNLAPDHVDEINRSHDRCAAFGLSRIERPDLGLLARADLEIARSRNLRLHQHAAPVMELLYDQIVNTQSMVVLTDATGTIVHAIGDDDFLSRASKVALLPGAVWSESHKGTNAVGTALISEVPTLVHADEHFFHANHFLTCSAAPILDPRGNILGVLDVSGDHRSYHQHTMALVKMSARMIENHWLTDDLRNVMRLHFHGRVDFIGTLMEGIIAVRPDGRIVGANRSALEQLGMSGATLRMQSLETLFGTSVGSLVDRFRSPLATPLAVRASTGRNFHLHARFDWPVWSSLAEAVAAQEPNAVTPSPALRQAAQALMASDAMASPPPVPREPEPMAAPALAPCTPADAQAAAVVERLGRALQRCIPGVLVGETGSGKEWLARAAHQATSRDRPFTALPCAGLSPAAIDAAFDGGGRAPVGVPAGTVYLDEIGELPVPAQQRLARRLDQAEGGVAPRAALVCASREPLRGLVDGGRLRDDLFYRLNGLSMRVPPLRERSDLIEIANAIIDAEGAARPAGLALEVIELLRAHRWPGNLRQLCNVLRAASALTAGGAPITRAQLSDDFVDDAIAAAQHPITNTNDALTHAASQSLDDLTLEAITQAVDAAHGNISEASRRLGISRNTIYRKLRWNRTSR